VEGSIAFTADHSRSRRLVQDVVSGGRSGSGVGRRVGLESPEEDVMSETPELELREREDETEERNGIGSESGVLHAFLILRARPGQRAGESHTVPKGQWTETDCVYRHDLDRSHANNDKKKKATVPTSRHNRPLEPGRP